MNEHLDLTKILEDCPKGFKLYSTIFGIVKFDKINKEDSSYPIVFITKYGSNYSTTTDGRHHKQFNGECILFPSKDQRDWSKFTAPWYKKEKFDPKTLKPFDKVLVRDNSSQYWECQFFSYITKDVYVYPYVCVYGSYVYCIPYNEDTKHLVGTMDEAPEYYR